MNPEVGQQNNMVYVASAPGVSDAPKKSHKPVALIILGVIGVLAVVAIGVLVFLLKGSDINWDTDYGDIGLDYIMPTTVQVGVKASEGVLGDVDYEGVCDKNNKIKQPVRDGERVKWDLSDGAGRCTLKASYQLRTIEKTFMVITNEVEGEELALEDIYRTKISQEADDDGDGLQNKQEKELGTKTGLTDTDGDGLADGYEINTTKTDPLKADTDNDGLNDASEIKVNLDPLKADTKKDGVRDGERKLSYVYNGGNVSLKLSGKGDIANTTIDITNGAALSKKAGLIPKLYSFYTAGDTTEVVATITYTDAELASAKISASDLVLYRYDLSNGKYEAVTTKVDTAQMKVSATIGDMGSYYVLGSRKAESLENKNSEILFVLDNSWSMFTNEQYKKMHDGKDFDGTLDANDPEGRRFQLTKELAERLSEKGAKIGIGEFSGDFVAVGKIGSKIDELKKVLNEMNEHRSVKVDGTNIARAIRDGAKEFSSGASLKTLVLLTDGIDVNHLSGHAETIAKEMADQNVRVCALGFGEGAYSNDLTTIAEKTGCKLFSSSDVTGLDEVFNNLEILLNDELADIDGDGKMDGYVMADSGFMVTRDGFSFKNYSSNLMLDGHCYGMATFAQLYYSRKMPLRHDAIKAAGLTSYSYNLNWSYFRDYQNLYDYKLRTNALKYVSQFGARYFGEEELVGKYVMKDGLLTYTDAVRKEIKKTGMFDFYEKKTKVSPADQEKKYGFSYEGIEKARLDEVKMQNSAAMDDVDRSLMNAIFAGQIRQTTVRMYSSGSAVGIDGNVIKRTNVKQMTNSNDFMNLITARLRRHEAPVILAYFSGGLHAMNAINLIQDAKDSNHYYVGVYDSNYPGEKRYLELKCSKYSCTTRSNSYYGESGEVIRMSISQAEDLKHFN